MKSEPRGALRQAAAWLLLGAMALAGCRPGPPTLKPPDDLPELVAALGAMGQEASVEALAYAAPVSSRPYALTIGEEQALVFAFGTPEEREAYIRSIIDRPAAGRPWADGAKVWAGGSLVVAYEGNDGGLVLIFDALFGDRVGVEPGLGEPYPPAVTAARKAAADRLGLDPQDLEATEFEPSFWPDTCLGVGNQGEICEREQISGWRILLRHGERLIEVRTDELGQEVRFP